MTLPDLLDIARRIEGSKAEGIARAARRWLADDPAYPLQVRDVAGALQVVAPGDNHLRGTRGLGLDLADVGDALIDELERACRAMNAPSRIDVYRLEHDTLEARLTARGYEAGEVVQAWVFDPAHEPAPDDRATPGLTVTSVPKDDEEALDAFADLVTRGNADGSPSAADIQLGRMNARGPTAHCFIASLDGEPAGGGVVSVKRRLGAFYFASTLPEHRRRGVQTALMRARLACAAFQGVDFTYVHCHADSPTRRNAERLGFHYAYTKVSMDRDLSVSPV